METPLSPGGAITQTTSRRTLVKGVAWSVPAVSLAAATPAFAASPTPTVNGLINAGRICSEATAPNPSTQISLNDNSPVESRGLWVLHAPPETIADGATVTVFLPESVTVPDAEGNDVVIELPDPLSFTGGGGGVWSDPIKDENPPGGGPLDGYRAFTLTYNGSWARFDGSPAGQPASYYSQAATRFSFTSDAIAGPASLCDTDTPITIMVRRTVTVRGELRASERYGPL